VRFYRRIHNISDFALVKKNIERRKLGEV
jgi:hypothetical protein